MAIDLDVSVDLAEALELPECKDIELPKPELPQITLPTGGTLKAVADISKGIPTDCSLNLNLLVQIAPLLGSIECLVNLLKLIEPLVSIITGLAKAPPDGPEFPTPEVLKKLTDAVEDLAPCLAIPVPGGPTVLFVRDILCLILKILRCVVDQLRSVTELLGGLTIQLETAKADGNTELVKVIECAQKNAEVSAQHIMDSLGSVGVVLDLLGPFFSLAQIDAIQLPAFTSDTNLQALNQSLQSLQNLVDTIQAVVDAPPLNGCPA